MSSVPGSVLGACDLWPYLRARNELASAPLEARMMSGPQRPVRIVRLIEDDDSVRTLLQARLGHLGFATVPAAGGAEGVAEYRRDPNRYAFVISDIHMPGLDGPAAL